MNVQHLTPILSVRSLEESFVWFAALGWSKDWDYGEPPNFGGVRSGNCDIVLCKDGQGARGDRPMGVGHSDYLTATSVYLRLPSPAEVDALYARAQQSGLSVAGPPTDQPWNSRDVASDIPMATRFALGHRSSRGDVVAAVSPGVAADERR